MPQKDWGKRAAVAIWTSAERSLAVMFRVCCRQNRFPHHLAITKQKEHGDVRPVSVRVVLWRERSQEAIANKAFFSEN